MVIIVNVSGDLKVFGRSPMGGYPTLGCAGMHHACITCPSYPIIIIIHTHIHRKNNWMQDRRKSLVSNLDLLG